MNALGKVSKQGATLGDALQTTTVRDFSGGLNVVDNDLSMAPKFARVLDNLERGIDGTLTLRRGTKLLGTLSVNGDGSNIINVYYFNAFVIAVQASGRVTRTSGTGVTTSMATLWGTTTYVSFTIFNSQLILVNGVNKPLIIEGNPNKANFMQCIFLIDLGAGTNVNTPIGKYVISHGQYTIIAGVTSDPSSLYISARGTSGTFRNDPPPNDAIILDLGPRVSKGSSVITGMVAYRDKLLVTFENGVLPMNLGVYTGSPTSVHTPSDDGFIEEFGCLAHRSLISVGDDTFYCDNVGVNSIQRVVLYNTLRPQRASNLIDPEITKLIQPLSQEQISQYVFSVYDIRHRRYMLFVPVFAIDNVTIIETIVFSYTNIPGLRIDAWARLRGWLWSSSCRTALQNIIFAQRNKLYSYDFDNTISNADYVGDTLYAADGSGVPITFVWELPWADFHKTMNLKKMRYLALDTQGRAIFTVKMYTDYILTNGAGVDSPALSTTMVGGDSGGYGIQYYGNSPYGGGRVTNETRLFAWNATFKTAKFRFEGSTKLPLKFIAVSLAYQRGSIRR